MTTNGLLNKLLGTTNELWTIADRVGDLVLIGDPFYQGTVIDLASKRIVCPALQPVVECTEDQLSVDVNNIYLRRDLPTTSTAPSIAGSTGMMTGAVQTVPIRDCRITIAKEGVLVSVWRDLRGIVHFSTKDKIDADGECYNAGTPYTALWQLLGGKNPKDLYSENDKSQVVYRFILCHPELLRASLESGVGQLVYLGALSLDSTGADIKRLKTVNTPVHKKLFMPSPLCLADSNKFLQCGYHSIKQPTFDKRLGTGESVIIECKGIVYHVKSRAYAYRLSLHPSNDLRRDSEMLLKLSRDEETYFATNLPMASINDLDRLSELLVVQGCSYFSTEDFVVLSTKKDRERMAWLLFIASTPLSQQRRAYGLYLKWKTPTDP